MPALRARSTIQACRSAQAGVPTINVWVLGLLLGVDLIAHGFAWLLYALQSARTTA